MRKKLILLLASMVLLCGCASKAAEPIPTPEPAPPTAEPTPIPTPSPSPKPVLPLSLVTAELPEALFAPCPEAGSVVSLSYETEDYLKGDGIPVEKQMQVYLPAGYDEKGQYDVLFMMHVAGADENFWFGGEMYYASYEHGYIAVSVKNLIDNMIYEGYCPPCIVISLDGFLNDALRSNHDTSTAYSQFERELAEDILPCAAAELATYAAGSDDAALREAREHFAFLGASYGAYMAYLSVMPANLEYISCFALSGGGAMDYDVLFSRWQAEGTAELPIKCLYIGTGQLDDRAGPEGSYLRFLNMEKFSADNLYFTLYDQTGHEPREWINSLFNSLQLFFK